MSQPVASPFTAYRRPSVSMLGPLAFLAFVGCMPASDGPVPGRAAGVSDVPAPAAHFGFEIGDDRRLADWDALSSYYDMIARSSPRVSIDTLGPTTEGRPFIVLTITSPDNHRRIEEYRDINRRLADPRTISGADELEALLERGRVVVLLTNHIHSTEVASGQMPARLVHHLAVSGGDRVRDILNNAIVLHIPSLNPDGTQLVAEWWDRWVGTEFEAAPLPRLYHYYVGHDNNRDWYALTQVETRLTVERVHNAWRPQITHDMHGRGGYSAARFYTTPYVDPIDENVDPRLIAASTQAGSYIAAEMIREGMVGVVVNANYDAWTPARSYQHYHGGARVLSETARANLAAPQHFARGELEGRDGYDVERSWNYPVPWQEGQWRLQDQIEYMKTGALALLTNAARNRRYWLENFHQVHERAVSRWATWPHAWIIAGGADGHAGDSAQEPVGLTALLRILRTGDVEVYRATEAFSADGRSFGPGTYIVPMDQPYGSFVQTLLARVPFPGGPDQLPRRVTAHNLPLLMGVDAYPARQPLTVALSEPIGLPSPRYQTPPGLGAGDRPRIGVYQGSRETNSGGWTRWLLDQHRIVYDPLQDVDVRAGGLRDAYDVILFQDQSAASIVDGWPDDVMPPEFAGGLGDEGVRAVADFVRAGGRLVAIDRATDFAIENLGLELGVRNLTGPLPSDEFYVGGAILRLVLDGEHARSAGMPEQTIAWFHGRGDRPPPYSRAFHVDDPGVRTIGRYGVNDLLLQGWGRGLDLIAGQAALVEARAGDGSVVLFGFQPNYRGHSVATWPLLFHALAGTTPGLETAMTKAEDPQ